MHRDTVFIASKHPGACSSPFLPEPVASPQLLFPAHLRVLIFLVFFAVVGGGEDFFIIFKNDIKYIFRVTWLNLLYFTLQNT